MNFRISRQRIQPTISVKYFGLVIDEFLNWKTHFTNLRAKLERSTGLRCKLRYFVSANLLRTAYLLFLIHIFVTNVKFVKFLDSNTKLSKRYLLKIEILLQDLYTMKRKLLGFLT